jgi:hypothetical protein
MPFGLKSIAGGYTKFQAANYFYSRSYFITFIYRFMPYRKEYSLCPLLTCVEATRPENLVGV